VKKGRMHGGYKSGRQREIVGEVN